MKNKKSHKAKFLLIIIAIPIILYFIPIKFVVKSESLTQKDRYYIAMFVPEGSTDSGWHIIGDQDNNKYPDCKGMYVTDFNGDDPRDFLNAEIFHQTYFIIYGTLEKQATVSMRSTALNGIFLMK